jgi:facilitated trehalose transporter
MTCCALAVGCFMHFKLDNNYVLLICVLGFVCFSALGYLVIPWTLIGEILPIEVNHFTRCILHITTVSFPGQRKKLSGILVAVAYLLMSSVVKSYPYTIAWLGAEGLFFLFAVTSFAGVVFVLLFLPETMGKSFREIEKRFS